jgi:2-haloacid dehalogenase
MDYGRFTHLTFDCYGTLIDWEAGILAALKPLAVRHGVSADEEQLLRLYVKYEAEQESGLYRPYRRVLQGVTERIASALGFTPTEEELKALPDSVGEWPPFADTVQALHRLKARYKLVILSNIDNAMFAQTQRRLATPFDAVITAEQVGSYKPAYGHFQAALAQLGVPREQILHVAQSLYHDHVPAQELGFSSVWVNRPSRLAGVGLAPPVQVTPNLEVPDLKTLAGLMGL